MIKIERKKIEIEIDGSVYFLSKPTIQQSEDYRTSLEAVKDSEGGSLKLISEYYECLGLPKEVAASLDMDMFKELSECLSGVKKN